MLSNHFLRSLTLDSQQQILSHSLHVLLPLRAELYQAEELPTYAYFITSGLASEVIPSRGGGVVEVAVVGNEGVVGALFLLGPALLPTRCFMQLAGSASRIRVTELRRIFAESAEVRGRMLEFVQVQALTLSQVAGCHRLHGAEQRLARWLLMVQDRVTESTLGLTQVFLAEMLGSQRTTVSAVAAVMQQNGLIEYSRGHLKIVNRPALEAAACECYPIVQKLMTNLYAQDRKQTIA